MRGAIPALRHMFFNITLLLRVPNFSNSVIMCHDSFIFSYIAGIIRLMNVKGRVEPVVGLSDSLRRMSNISCISHKRFVVQISY
jgi:hypothetical protein